MEPAAAAGQKAVCVTGAGGFIASWLVKLLLSRGHYAVRGTVQDPGDSKNGHLKALEGAGVRLQLFKADLMDYDRVAAAVAGCEGVFHVANPVPSGRSSNPEAEVVAPAVTCTLNVLKVAMRRKLGASWWCLQLVLCELILNGLRVKSLMKTAGPVRSTAERMRIGTSFPKLWQNVRLFLTRQRLA